MIVVLILIISSASWVSARVFTSRTSVTDEEYFQMPAIFHLDKYDECIDLKKKGLYCSAVIQLEPTTANNSLWKIIKKVIDNPYNYRHDRLRHGLCLPLSCPNVPVAHYKPGFNDSRLMKDIGVCYTEKYYNLGLRATVEDLVCENDEPLYEIGLSAKLFALFMAALLTMVIISTYYDGRARYEDQEKYEKLMDNKVGRLMICFSLASNWERLRQENTRVDAKKLAFIQGIRFFNMFFVIFSHTTLAAFTGPVHNPRFLEQSMSKPENMFLMNGSHIVQTNLVITGWLLVYNFMNMFEKKGKVTIQELVGIFVNRYIRITPTLFIYLWLNSTWMPHMTNGPNWIRMVHNDYEACKETWWVFFLQLNNYIWNGKAMCMQHTWYLACDTQLFVVALLILPLILKYPRHAVKIIIAMISLGIAVSFAHVYFADLDIIIRSTPEMTFTYLLHVKEWHATLLPMHINLASYFVGILFGYLFHQQFRHKKVLTNKFSVGLWYFMTYVPSISVVMVAFLFYQEGFEYSASMSAANQSLSRVIFGLCLTFGMVGFADGNGWFSIWLLNWGPLQVLGRVSFTAYVVHPMVIRLRQGSIRTPYYASSHNIMSDTISDVTIAYLLATLVCLFIELPISALQNLIANRRHTKTANNNKKEE